MPVVNLQILAGIESNQSALEFNWKCVDFNQGYMDFVLNFTYFRDVSASE